ncbi:MAG: hypothetical protein SFY92_08880 [Verrucomicrobiae bacterium]|nr:hypothetical protein [Verrucomicrobiae bacterium]
MPFNDTAALVLAEASRFLDETSTALEIFDQTLDVSDAVLDHLLQVARPAWRVADLEKLRGMTLDQRRPHLPLLYAALGIPDWVAVDSHAGRGNLVMDVNENFRARYGFNRFFDIVSNKGSTEHLFDQRQAFENIHNVCRTGGVMLHNVPTMNVFNHAFFGYHPLFFVELAEANGYGILDLRLANRWGDTIPVVFPSEAPADRRIYRPDPGKTAPALPLSLKVDDFVAKTVPGISRSPLSEAYEILSRRGEMRRTGNPGEIFVVAMLRKKTDDPFRVPYQGKFLSYIQTREFRERYAGQLSGRTRA